MTRKQEIDAAIEASVKTALNAIGLDLIRSEPFFGMGELKAFDVKQAA